MTQTQIRTGCGVTLDVTAFGNGAVMLSPVTPCCSAATTDSGNFVVCKACFHAVPDVYGYAADDYATTVRLVRWLGNCPDEEGCALHTLWQAEHIAA